MELQTLGDRLKAKRMDLGLLQKDVGKILGVTPDTVLNWEKSYSTPVGERLSSLQRFLKTKD